jgi:hypothetical protein
MQNTILSQQILGISSINNLFNDAYVLSFSDRMIH